MSHIHTAFEEQVYLSPSSDHVSISRRINNTVKENARISTLIQNSKCTNGNQQGHVGKKIKLQQAA